MPIYTYTCKSGHEFEELRSVAERNELRPCPVCKAKTERKAEAPATPVLNPARPVRGRKGGYK